MDGDNPRSLVYQLDHLAADVRLMPKLRRGAALSEPERLVLETSTALRLAETSILSRPRDDGTRPELDAFLTRMVELLCRTADAIDADRFVHQLPQSSLLASS